MKIIKVRIEGMTPLIINRFAENSEQSKSSRRQLIEDKDPRETAQQAAYVNSEGNFYFNGFAIPSAMGAAGANHKMRGTRKSLRFIVPSAVRVEDSILIGNGKSLAKNFEVDSRPVTIPATKGKIMRHRPKFNNWSAEFELNINENLLPVETAHRLLNEAGEFIGIGDFRPEKRGPFGTFRVVHFK